VSRGRRAARLTRRGVGCQGLQVRLIGSARAGGASCGKKPSRRVGLGAMRAAWISGGRIGRTGARPARVRDRSCGRGATPPRVSEAVARVRGRRAVQNAVAIRARVEVVDESLTLVVDVGRSVKRRARLPAKGLNEAPSGELAAAVELKRGTVVGISDFWRLARAARVDSARRVWSAADHAPGSNLASRCRRGRGCAHGAARVNVDSQPSGLEGALSLHRGASAGPTMRTAVGTQPRAG